MLVLFHSLHSIISILFRLFLCLMYVLVFLINLCGSTLLQKVFSYIYLNDILENHLFKEKFSKLFVDNSYMYLYTTTSINTSFPWCPPNLTFCLLRYPIFYFSTFLTFFISWFEHLKLRVRYHFKLSTHFRVYNWTVR